MLGSEYNWLIRLTHSENGGPRVTLVRGGLLTVAVAFFCFFCLALRAETVPQQLIREAGLAAKAGDDLASSRKLESALVLRPDYPRVRYSLARVYASSGRTADAIAQLRELAAMGLSFDITQDARLASLRSNPDFVALGQMFAANPNPVGRDSAFLTTNRSDGIFEGIAIRDDGRDSYLSDVHNRCVWHCQAGAAGNALEKFSSDADPLDGVFGLKLDEAHQALWAGTAALPEMKGYTEADKGRSALVEFDLVTGRVRHSYLVPSDGLEHVLGDVLLAADGSVYASDSVAPVIWRLAPHGSHLEKWLESAEFVSLQGLAWGADSRHLFVADYANGLWSIDLASRGVMRLPAPAHRTLFGIDGLYAVAGGLIGIQNGVNPQRVIRIALDASQQVTDVSVLLAGQPAMNDLSLGQVSQGRFHVIGNSGWSLYDDPHATPASRAVTVYTTPL